MTIRRSLEIPLWGFAALVFAGTLGAALLVRSLSDQKRVSSGEVLDLALTSAEQRRAAAYRSAVKSVVHIRAVHDEAASLAEPLPSQAVPPGQGSGLIWNADGLIVTSAHLLRGHNQIQVTLFDGSVWEAEYVGQLDQVDVAVLAIAAPRKVLFPLPLGQSASLVVGQETLVIGNPFGLKTTLTSGIISGLDRSLGLGSGHVVEGVIQTDSAINPGNSGGPVLDSLGRVIGMATAVHLADADGPAFNVGVGYAVPVDLIALAVPELIRVGIAPNFELGFHLAPDWQARIMLAPLGVKGVLPLEVVPGSPAHRAGLNSVATAQGALAIVDVIVGLQGQACADRIEFMRHLEAHPPGTDLSLEVAQVLATLAIDSEPGAGIRARLISRASEVKRRIITLQLEER
jgi:S1-C subfamily serine protease